VGDGKIIVQPLDNILRIRTGEEDSEALTTVTLEQRQPGRADAR
jgi:nitrogen regulatory protein P-II 1